MLLEPVSGPKPYPLRTAADVVAVLDRVGADNLGLLCDVFHLADNGDDIDAAVTAYDNRIAHVQVANHSVVTTLDRTVPLIEDRLKLAGLSARCAPPRPKAFTNWPPR